MIGHGIIIYSILWYVPGLLERLSPTEAGLSGCFSACNVLHQSARAGTQRLPLAITAESMVQHSQAVIFVLPG